MAAFQGRREEKRAEEEEEEEEKQEEGEEKRQEREVEAPAESVERGEREVIEEEKESGEREKANEGVEEHGQEAEKQDGEQQYETLEEEKEAELKREQAACSSNCLDCSSASTCTLCEHGYANVAGACEKAWTRMFADRCCRSQLSLCRAPMRLHTCFYLASTKPRCNPNLIFLAQTGCYCVKQGETCSPYNCNGVDVFEREALSTNYKVVSSDSYCAYRDGLYPFRCLVATLPPGVRGGIAASNCEAACNQYSWCLAYSLELEGGACSLVSSSGSCPEGKASSGPVATNMVDLRASNASGYKCVSKISYGYEFVGSGVCRSATGLEGRHRMHTGTSKLADCQLLCNAWLECEGFDIEVSELTRCVLWTRAAQGNGQNGYKCYSKRLQTISSPPKTTTSALTTAPAPGLNLAARQTSNAPGEMSHLQEQMQQMQQQVSLCLVGLLVIFCVVIAFGSYLMTARRRLSSRCELSADPSVRWEQTGQEMQGNPAHNDYEEFLTDSESRQ